MVPCTTPLTPSHGRIAIPRFLRDPFVFGSCCGLASAVGYTAANAFLHRSRLRCRVGVVRQGVPDRGDFRAVVGTPLLPETKARTLATTDRPHRHVGGLPTVWQRCLSVVPRHRGHGDGGPADARHHDRFERVSWGDCSCGNR